MTLLLCEGTESVGRCRYRNRPCPVLGLDCQRLPGREAGQAHRFRWYGYVEGHGRSRVAERDDLGQFECL